MQGWIGEGKIVFTPAQMELMATCTLDNSVLVCVILSLPIMICTRAIPRIAHCVWFYFYCLKSMEHTSRVIHHKSSVFLLI